MCKVLSEDLNIFICYSQGRIQDFPLGGVWHLPSLGRGQRPPMRVLFGENYVKMKELGSVGGSTGNLYVDPPLMAADLVQR